MFIAKSIRVYSPLCLFCNQNYVPNESPRAKARGFFIGCPLQRKTSRKFRDTLRGNRNYVPIKENFSHSA